MDGFIDIESSGMKDPVHAKDKKGESLFLSNPYSGPSSKNKKGMEIVYDEDLNLL